MQVEFLSYEGSFTAEEGPANGMTSTDIVVFQSGSTPVGSSLALVGSGSGSGAFEWVGSTVGTPGSINTGQYAFSASQCSGFCDLVLACGTTDPTPCEARQSTFFKYDDPPALYAVDADSETCMKTSAAENDPNPQWLSVDLELVRLIGTIRFRSDQGSASDFHVAVSTEGPADAAVLNPSSGALLPALSESCAVSNVGDAVFEATCSAAVKGRHLFISRSVAAEQLSVCDVEVFDHTCVPEVAPPSLVRRTGYAVSGPD
eukprot:2930562-Rhodomonas_salina.2